ncbi:MAG: glycosyltransferase [Candidatus Riflebacteria bacterium]|nr:glycosyltransferase [Candidatus Riflebacteria bacterium]
MMNNKNVYASVVIPVYNRADLLEKCLIALSQQKTSFSHEVIVVDDCSVEDLSNVRYNFEKGDLKITWLRLPENSGPAVARNAGIKVAEGEIIVFTDSDCVPIDSWLQKMLVPFSDAAVSGVKGSYKTTQTDTWARLSQVEFEERFDLLDAASSVDFVDTYSGAFRKKHLIETGGFDTSFPKADNEDVELSFRIKALAGNSGGKFVFVRDAVVFHRHREGFWNYFRLKFNRGYWRSKVYEKHPKMAGKESYTPATLKIQFLLIVLLPFLFVLPIKKRNSSAVIFSLWLASCHNMFFNAYNKNNQDLIPAIPFFTAARAIAILSGMLYSFLSSVNHVLPVKIKC